MCSALYESVNPGMNKVYLKAEGVIWVHPRLKGIIIQGCKNLLERKASDKVQTAFSLFPSLSRFFFVHSVVLTDYNIPVMSGVL